MNKNEAEQNWIDEVWHTELYQDLKKENFEILDDYLKITPSKILDIGCGLAWESRLFNQKYGTELYLLDGDVSANESKPSKSSTVNYHNSADNFLFYHPLEKLDDELLKLDTKNYHLIDCNDIVISDEIKFDLVTSWVSCGFHYPVNTYRDLIKKHSHKDTKVIMDLRIDFKKTGMPQPEEGIEIVKIINRRKKYIMAEIKFL
jgi:SAM-dependent methyltransferase